MNDMELAEEIEQWLSEKAGDDLSAHSRSLYRKEWRTIIAALRRGPERPPSGEMVMVPRPTGMLKPFEVIGARLLAQFDNRFGIANPIQFTDNERQVIVAALKILLAALSAAEAEVRRPCPLCGRTDPHSHTSGPLGIS